MQIDEIVPGLIGVALGFGGAVALGREILEGRSASRWRQAPGRITASGVERVDDDGGAEETAVARLAYEYVVDGKTYAGSRLAFGAWVEGSRAVAKAIAARYPRGASVTVYYDPARPERAVLERRTSRRLWLFAVASALLGVVVGLALVTG